MSKLKALPIKHIHFKSINSTQDYVRNLSIPVEKYILVSAEQQTNGIAQKQRKWLSPCGNLYATIGMQLNKKYLSLLSTLPLITALSITEVIIKYNLTVELKWINDVLVNRKKIAGVLCESSIGGNKNFIKILIGFGVNINSSIEEFSILNQPATSLFIECKKTFNVQSILYSIVTQLHGNITKLCEQGFSIFLEKINLLMAFKNELIQLNLNEDHNSIITGIVLGLDQDGKLQLKTKNGIETFDHGRIILK